MKKYYSFMMAIFLVFGIMLGAKSVSAYVKVENGTYSFNSKVGSNMMLDVTGRNTADGTNIQIYENNETVSQQFDITHLGSGWYKILMHSSQKALDVKDGDKSPGANVQLYKYNGTDAQKWRFYLAGNGYYYIKNKLNKAEFCLDVDGRRRANGTNVQVYKGNGTDAQKWKLKRVIYPTGISLNTKSFKLTSIGASKKLIAAISPSNATQKIVSWTTSNKDIATVSNGIVKAVGSGKATITARTSNGKNVSATVQVDDGSICIKEGLYTISTKLNSNLMLDVMGNQTADGTNIQVYKNNGTVSQKFKIEKAGNGWYKISNTFPKKCLDVQGASKTNNANIQLYKDNGTDAQMWRFYSAGNGYYTIMNKLQCYLHVDRGRSNSGTNVVSYEKCNVNAQMWKLTETTSQYVNIVAGLYTIKTKLGNKMVLDTEGNGTSNLTNIQIYKSNNTIAQKFSIQPTGDGWYMIINPLSGKCLDVDGASTKNRTNVRLYEPNRTDAQKWRVCQVNNDYVIKSKLGNIYLDVADGLAQNRANVQIYEGNGTDAQKWLFSETSAIAVMPNSITLDGVGTTRKLDVLYEPSNVFAANKSIIWSSSKPSVATVSNGTVKAVGAGSATITAKAYNGQTATAIVTVKVAGLGSPVPANCKFTRKSTDGKWYGYHDININVSSSTPVYALANGTVEYRQAYRTNSSGKQYLTSYGNFINFKSADNVYSAKYCHLSKFVGAQQQIINSAITRRERGSSNTHFCGRRNVKKGEIIGYIGETGNASGVHLHFELTERGRRIDPTSVIKGLI